MNNTGLHATLDVYMERNYSELELKSLCEKAIIDSGMNIVKYSSHEFTYNAFTAVWILAESHFTVHTYPEHLYATFDCYTCGDEGNPMLAINALLLKLKVKRATINNMKRGG